MVAAVVIPAFDLRAALRLRPGLETAPAALAPQPGKEPLLGSVTAAAAAKGARPGQVLIVSDDRTRRFLAPLPLTLLPLERERYEELEELGIRTIGQLAGLPGGAVAERLGPDGRHAWSLARGERDGRVAPRRPA